MGQLTRPAYNQHSLVHASRVQLIEDDLFRSGGQEKGVRPRLDHVEAHSTST